MRRIVNRIITLTLLAVGAPLLVIAAVPAALAFPHHAQFGDVAVYSVDPIPDRMAAILAAADARTSRSAIAAPLGKRSIYLTDGGWRWRLLAPTAQHAFAITRAPFGNSIFNRSDIAHDRVTNGAAVANVRTLSGTIAHETTHLLIAHRYGWLAPFTVANWKAEGYCDYVAGESTLSDAQAARLEREGKNPPALFYYEARRRVARALTADPNVDHLFPK
ncbi:hypothetical protein [Stakelama marina]|uniref:Uncharacterized protein n=1 Tax=Stakelama marina TaxID=2826939 RepID=A0A8T4IA74_9SPHN|nr:hypothetical protein [Stakelama marina]MBR0551557.1 hypothetical protein [Stakelama marina]